jgi:cysteine desulfurase
MDAQVVKAMRPYFGEKYGNASSIHKFGREVKEVVDGSRKVIAEALGAGFGEVYFTGSATESNNWALKGVAWANQGKGKHLIVSAIEHGCVMKSAEWLGNWGFKMVRVGVDMYGMVDPGEIEKVIGEDTMLVSVMQASNEIGTIQPIEEIGRICRSKGVYLHVDAAQSFGKMPVKVDELKVDLLTASAHKMYGPQGIALLYVRKGVKIEPLLHGGGQEGGMRSSTSNVPGIVGFAKAVEICEREREEEGKRISELRDKLINGVLESVPRSCLNGHPEKRLGNNVSLRFDFVEGEALVMELDARGIATSTASACASPKLEPSHVLLAMGVRPEEAHGSLRLTLGRWTTEKEIEYVLKVLPEVVRKLRKMSPFKWRKVGK